MTVPVYPSLACAVAACRGAGVTIRRRSPVSGGDINRAECLRLSDGSALFLKSNARANERFFAAEALGLTAIAATGAIGTPTVLGRGVDGERAFLLMELVRSGRRAADYWERFGRELAALHRADTAALVPGGRFGFLEDNFIGATPQRNTPADSWVDFFRTRRLEPQIQLASRWFDRPSSRSLLRLLDHLDERLPEPSQPALLHGDLWSGNFLTGADGRAWLIDPAAYVGHPEADLAMTELFGGFSAPFYRAYQEAAALEPGYPERRDLYNLYHLLNHLNLFGGGYLSSVLRTVERYA